MIEGADVPSCELNISTVCTTFTVTIENLPEGTTAWLVYELSPVVGGTQMVREPVFEGLDEIDVCGLWPGIGFGQYPIEIVYSPSLIIVYADGTEEVLDTATASIFYDPFLMKEICEIPSAEELPLIDPHCYELGGGEWGMAWGVVNPNPYDLEFGWQFKKGDISVPGITARTTHRSGHPGDKPTTGCRRCCADPGDRCKSRTRKVERHNVLPETAAAIADQPGAGLPRNNLYLPRDQAKVILTRRVDVKIDRCICT